MHFSKSEVVVSLIGVSMYRLFFFARKRSRNSGTIWTIHFVLNARGNKNPSVILDN